jgi:hypothetical protein
MAQQSSPRSSTNPLDEVFGPIMSLFGQKRPTMAEYSTSPPGGPAIEYWKEPERAGWLMKQGEHIKTWRRRWFVLKGGKIFWFKDQHVSAQSVPRGVIEVKQCLSVKGAEDALNKPCAFEISTHVDLMYFIADSDKEKEDWINAIGRAIVHHSASMCEEYAQDE